MKKFALAAGIVAITGALFSVSPLHYVEQAAAQQVWTAWARADGDGRQPVFFARGTSQNEAVANAQQKCQSDAGKSCTVRVVGQGRCIPITMGSGREMRPSDC